MSYYFKNVRLGNLYVGSSIYTPTGDALTLPSGAQTLVGTGGSSIMTGTLANAGGTTSLDYSVNALSRLEHIGMGVSASSSYGLYTSGLDHYLSALKTAHKGLVLNNTSLTMSDCDEAKAGNTHDYLFLQHTPEVGAPAYTAITDGYVDGYILTTLCEAVADDVKMQWKYNVKGTGATSVMTFDKTLVGINNESPAEALDVTGSIKLSSSLKSGSYVYTMPSATGTLALTSQIPSIANLVTTDTDQTISGIKTFNSGKLIATNITNTGTLTLPTTTGTIALTSQIPSIANLVTTDTDQTVTGIKTFSSGKLVASNITNTGTLTLPTTTGTLQLIENQYSLPQAMYWSNRATVPTGDTSMLYYSSTNCKLRIRDASSYEYSIPQVGSYTTGTTVRAGNVVEYNTTTNTINEANRIISTNTTTTGVTVTSGVFATAPAGTCEGPQICLMSTNLLLYIWLDAGNNVYVGTVSVIGNTFTQVSQIALTATAETSARALSVCKISKNRAVAVFSGLTSASTIMYLVNISNTGVVTNVSNTTLIASSSFGCKSILMGTQFIITMLVDTAKMWLYPVRIEGATITVGTRVEVTDNTPFAGGSATGIVRVSSTAFAISYADSGGNVRVAICTTDGTSITTNAGYVAVTSIGSISNLLYYNNVLFACGISVGTVRVAAGTIAGTVITFGASININIASPTFAYNAGLIPYYGNSIQLIATKFTGAQYATAVTFSGTTVANDGAFVQIGTGPISTISTFTNMYSVSLGDDGSFITVAPGAAKAQAVLYLVMPLYLCAREQMSVVDDYETNKFASPSSNPYLYYIHSDSSRYWNISPTVSLLVGANAAGNLVYATTLTRKGNRMEVGVISSIAGTDIRSGMAVLGLNQIAAGCYDSVLGTLNYTLKTLHYGRMGVEVYKRSGTAATSNTLASSLNVPVYAVPLGVNSFIKINPITNLQTLQSVPVFINATNGLTVDGAPQSCASSNGGDHKNFCMKVVRRLDTSLPDCYLFSCWTNATGPTYSLDCQTLQSPTAGTYAIVNANAALLAGVLDFSMADMTSYSWVLLYRLGATNTTLRCRMVYLSTVNATSPTLHATIVTVATDLNSSSYVICVRELGNNNFAVGYTNSTPAQCVILYSMTFDGTTFVAQPLTTVTKATCTFTTFINFDERYFATIGTKIADATYSSIQLYKIDEGEKMIGIAEEDANAGETCLVAPFGSTYRNPVFVSGSRYIVDVNGRINTNRIVSDIKYSGRLQELGICSKSGEILLQKNIN